MIDAAVRFVSGALRDPVSGVAALVSLVPDVPAGLVLPVPVVVDETDTGWLARGGGVGARELAALSPTSVVLAVTSEAEVSADDESNRDLPWTRCPVLVHYLAPADDMVRFLARARHSHRAVRRSVLAQFAGPTGLRGQVSAHGVTFGAPDPTDFALLRAVDRFGDDVVALPFGVALRALDAWAWHLV